MKSYLAFLIIAFLSIGCSVVASFVKTNNVEWSSIQLRDNLDFD